MNMESGSNGREWEKAKELIRGVMETVERLQSTNAPEDPNRGRQQSESAFGHIAGPSGQHSRESRGRASSLPSVGDSSVFAINIPRLCIFSTINMSRPSIIIRSA